MASPKMMAKETMDFPHTENMDSSGPNKKSNENSKADDPKPKRKGAWNVLARAKIVCCKRLRFSPLKLLCRARNAYVQTMLSCKQYQAQKNAVELPLPATFKSSSRREEDNLRRLIKMTEIKLQLQLNVQEAVAMDTSSTTSTVIMPARPPTLAALRSASYGATHMTTAITIAPIDEDSPCYFPGSFKKRWATPLPRTASCGTTAPPSA